MLRELLQYFLISLLFSLAWINFAQCQAIVPSKAIYDYNDVISKSVLFYEAQRSGRLWTNNRISWRGDSAVNDFDDGNDLSGGYYTAEGAVKMSYGTSWTTTILAWGVLSYSDGYGATGQLPKVMTSIRWYSSSVQLKSVNGKKCHYTTQNFLRWAVTYLQKIVLDNSEMYAQIGSNVAERGTWNRPESFKGVREYFKTNPQNIGTELLAETSAAMAATALIFQGQNDANSANKLIEISKKLFQICVSTTPSSQAHINHDLMNRYGIDNNMNDDIAWAAAWLFRVTNAEEYYNHVVKYYNSATAAMAGVTEFSWRSKLPGIMLLIEISSGQGDLLPDLLSFCDNVATNKDIRTPKGLLHNSILAPSMIASNAAFICLRTSELTAVENTPRAKVYRDFARKQLHYLLGDSGKSFLVGFGKNYPKRPYHKGSSCPKMPLPCGLAFRDTAYPNPNLLNGALVAGPDTADKYFDARKNGNSFIGIEFNAGFQSAIAGLRSRELKNDYITKTGNNPVLANNKNMAPTPGVLLTAAPAALPTHNYGKAIHLSLLFYEAQRSGNLPANNRIPWRRASALGDKGENGEDLSGGYFDGSGYVKYSYPLSFTITLLSWGGIEYKSAYDKVGEFNNLLAAVKWGTDYLLNCHPSKYLFYAQVGKVALDKAYWGRAEDMEMDRPAYKLTQRSPGSEVVAEASAALSAASLLFRPYDSKYADLLVQHAKGLYEFASKYIGYSRHSVPDTMSEYATDAGFQDELVWAATWLYKATKLETYLELAESRYTQQLLEVVPPSFYFDNKIAGVQLLLAQLTGKQKYKISIVQFCDMLQLKTKVTYTPKGLIFLSNTASNKHAANVASICLMTSTLKDLDPGRQSAYQRFATNQIGYLLGDLGQSYVIGYGRNSPRHPYHKESSCPRPPTPCNIDMLNMDGPNPQVLNGALVSGPDVHDGYKDVRTDYQRNSVSLDTNAGFQTTVAGLLSLQIEVSPEKDNGSFATYANINLMLLLSIALVFYAL